MTPFSKMNRNNKDKILKNLTELIMRNFTDKVNTSMQKNTFFYDGNLWGTAIKFLKICLL